MSLYKTQRVVLDITVRTDKVASPDTWDWYDIVNVDGCNDNLNVVSITDIPLDTAQVQQMADTDPDSK